MLWTSVPPNPSWKQAKNKQYSVRLEYNKFLWVNRWNGKCRLWGGCQHNDTDGHHRGWKANYTPSNSRVLSEGESGTHWYILTSFSQAFLMTHQNCSKSNEIMWQNSESHGLNISLAKRTDHPRKAVFFCSFKVSLKEKVVTLICW